MWFKFKGGYESISVERQNFSIEIKDDEGVGYFRAPDHFAPIILNTGLCALAATVPEGAPEDLPKADPLRDGLIEKLTREQQGLRDEVTNLRADLIAARAQIEAAIKEKQTLTAQLLDATAKVIRLEEEAEETPPLRAIPGGKAK